jgi:hypothetical protein
VLTTCQAQCPLTFSSQHPFESSAVISTLQTRTGWHRGWVTSLVTHSKMKPWYKSTQTWLSHLFGITTLRGVLVSLLHLRNMGSKLSNNFHLFTKQKQTDCLYLNLHQSVCYSSRHGIQAHEQLFSLTSVPLWLLSDFTSVSGSSLLHTSSAILLDFCHSPDMNSQFLKQTNLLK